MRAGKLSWILTGVILAGILLRVLMTMTAVHGDLIMQAGWGKWISDNGIKGFYENEVWIYGWPNHPPLISWTYGEGFQIYKQITYWMVRTGFFIAKHHLGAAHIPWFYDFIRWWSDTKFSDTPFKWGELISMKLIPIMADGVMAWLIYKFIGEKTDKKTGIIGAAIYLFSPFAVYESAWWGQNDQLALIVMLLAFRIAINKKWGWLGPLLMAISIMLKPTTLIFGPFMVFVMIREIKDLKNAVIGGILAAAAYILVARWFSDLPIILFSKNLQRQIFAKGEMWTWVNTFNFWRVVTGYLTDYRQKFFGLSLATWGYLLFFAAHIPAFLAAKKRDWQGVLKGIFIVGLAGFLVVVTMHERYLFTAVTAGLILAIINKRLLPYWIAMSLIFWVNMYNGWWIPSGTGWLRSLLTFDDFYDGIVPKILSGANLVLAMIMVRIIMAKASADRPRQKGRSGKKRNL